MRIAESAGLSWPMLLLMLLMPVAAAAHPVAQGAMELRVEPGRVVLDVHAALEQVLVQAAYGPAAGAPLAERIRRHGDYLRVHVRLAADGARLVADAPEVLPARPGRAAWRLTYALPAKAAATRLTLDQDVLREIDYAPGNPWEASYVLQLADAGGARAAGLLASAQPRELLLATPVLPAPPAPSAADWLVHGLRHILGGYDHLLFVAALTLGARRLGELLWLVAAFTLAHTLTLTCAALDWIRLPPAFVEPVIAASIVAVAALNVFAAGEPRTPQRRRLCAFGFGLFHGLGFAGGLLEAFADLGATSALTAICAFSVGVELGHLAVVLPVWGLLVGLRHRHAGSDPRALRRGASVAISLAGLLYLAAALGHGPLA